MTRMGHDSMNAALIYQHASREADQAIADALNARLTALYEIGGAAVDGQGVHDVARPNGTLMAREDKD